MRARMHRFLGVAANCRVLLTACMQATLPAPLLARCRRAQIALQIGTTPKRWQWIALFEVAAGLVLLGLLAALSLMGQYWGILSGRQQYDGSASAPLLGGDEAVRVRARAHCVCMMHAYMSCHTSPLACQQHCCSRSEQPPMPAAAATPLLPCTPGAAGAR